VLIAFCLLSGTAFAQEQNLAATITDFRGDEIAVAELRARYESADELRTVYGPGDALPGRVWSRGFARDRATLIIELALREDRTAREESVRIAFADLRRILFESPSAAPYPPEKILLERLDGSRITMEKSDKTSRDYDIFEERDSRGEVKRAIRPGRGKTTVSCRFKDGSFLMTGFAGRTKTATRLAGKFFIELHEVRSIVIK